MNQDIGKPTTMKILVELHQIEQMAHQLRFTIESNPDMVKYNTRIRDRIKEAKQHMAYIGAAIEVIAEDQGKENPL